MERAGSQTFVWVTPETGSKTGIGEDRMYFVVRGHDLEAVDDALQVVNSANAALGDYATRRRQTLSTT